ncbi:hypothetical protein CYCD_30300 [Tenuifilaceae bacterium CYCD]|nr:hypothetical protein CYCD_30300 [Tenuifilaceae bacterium CYCD]
MPLSYITKEPFFWNNLGADKHANLSFKGLDFVYGTHLRFIYYNEKNTTENPAIPVDQRTITYNTYNAGIGFTLGLYYNFSDKFAIGSELNPYIDYWYTKNNDDYGTKYKGYEYDILGNVSIISLKFRW